MNFLDLTLPTPAENLAMDEALLDACEAGGPEALRFWEPAQVFVVLGYSNQWRSEVKTEACARENVPIFRRCSGGGAVLQGPGCLNYSLVFKIPETGPLASLTETNCFIMHNHRDALKAATGLDVRARGVTDLTLGDLKFSGNAQRRKRRAVLFHGTFLLRFPLPLVEKFLNLPARQPDYRRNRPHRDFLTNLSNPAEKVKQTLKDLWHATKPATKIPLETAGNLARERYSQPAWNQKF